MNMLKSKNRKWDKVSNYDVTVHTIRVGFLISLAHNETRTEENRHYCKVI